MMLAIKWAREQKVPFLGICLGFQVAVIEWARNVCGLKDANSTEFDPTPFPDPAVNGLSISEPAPKSSSDPSTPHPVIIYMPEISRTHMGGTMRLGLRPTVFQDGTDWSTTKKLYGGREKIWERHRHRYEVNPNYVEKLETSGLLFIGRDENGERMQILELKGKLSCCHFKVMFISNLKITLFLLHYKHTRSSALDLSTPHQASWVLSPLPPLPTDQS